MRSDLSALWDTSFAGRRQPSQDPDPAQSRVLPRSVSDAGHWTVSPRVEPPRRSADDLAGLQRRSRTSSDVALSARSPAGGRREVSPTFQESGNWMLNSAPLRGRSCSASARSRSESFRIFGNSDCDAESASSSRAQSVRHARTQKYAGGAQVSSSLNWYKPGVAGQGDVCGKQRRHDFFDLGRGRAGSRASSATSEVRLEHLTTPAFKSALRHSDNLDEIEAPQSQSSRMSLSEIESRQHRTRDAVRSAGVPGFYSGQRNFGPRTSWKTNSAHSTSVETPSVSRASSRDLLATPDDSVASVAQSTAPVTRVARLESARGDGYLRSSAGSWVSSKQSGMSGSSQWSAPTKVITRGHFADDVSYSFCSGSVMPRSTTSSRSSLAGEGVSAPLVHRGRKRIGRFSPHAFDAGDLERHSGSNSDVSRARRQ
mmetsp:Transcript_21387/g.51890  ORF Transcript_21387/g.51890 Transcript_21387/m.51890 type:complete len:428 (+) Transcript_21387:46-1329(+)